jgi:pyridoxine kinase
MHQKKIAVISDISGFGRCSVTVSLPIISAFGIQCCPLPTAVLSNHSGYPDFFFDDYTDRMEIYMDMWSKLGLTFDGILTGFLGSGKQIDIVLEFIRRFKTPDTMLIVDPVMGDNGRLYSTYTPELAKDMTRLCTQADIIMPNLTEACVLADMPYQEQFHSADYARLCDRLQALGPKNIVLTGLLTPSTVGNYIRESGQADHILRRRLSGQPRAGTGDVFASVVAADQVKGNSFAGSVAKAADFVQATIRRSEELQIPAEDGVCFEEFLTQLR